MDTVANEVDLHAITLRLWTTDDEQWVESSLASVLNRQTTQEFYVWSSAWERTAASWFRGTIENEDFSKALREEVEVMGRITDKVVGRRDQASPRTRSGA
jgi:hypothetical protein